MGSREKGDSLNDSLPLLVISTKAAMLPRGEISLVVKVRVTGTEHLLLHTGRHIARMGVQKNLGSIC